MILVVRSTLKVGLISEGTDFEGGDDYGGGVGRQK